MSDILAVPVVIVGIIVGFALTATLAFGALVGVAKLFLFFAGLI